MMPRSSTRTFKAAVRDFEKASPWLGPEHAPAVVALQAMAEQLDKGDMAPALLGQFGLAFRALRKERPVETQRSALGAALEEAQAS